MGDRERAATSVIDLTASPAHVASPRSNPAADTLPSDAGDEPGHVAAAAMSADDELDWAREERLWREQGRYILATDSGGLPGTDSFNGEAEPWDAEVQAPGVVAASREVRFEVVGWRHVLAGAHAPSTPVPSPYTICATHVCKTCI